MLPANIHELLASFFNGNFSALATIAEHCDRQLMQLIQSERQRYPRSLLATTDLDREDIRQLLFMSLIGSWRQGKSYRPDNMLAYLRCLLRHQLIDKWREFFGSEPRNERIVSMRSIDLDTLPDNAPTPDEIAEQREERQLVAELMTPREKTIWELITQGYSPYEMAAILELPDSTVRSQLKRAVSRLQRDIPPDWRVDPKRGAVIRRPLKLFELRGRLRIRKPTPWRYDGRSKRQRLTLLSQTHQRPSLQNRSLPQLG
ncbi:MAG: RNA polymerase sigma factor [Planctomycetota bacterium]